jgi:hypothetical protein
MHGHKSRRKVSAWKHPLSWLGAYQFTCRLSPIKLPVSSIFLVPAEPVALCYMQVRMLHLDFDYLVEEIRFRSEIRILVEPQPRWYMYHETITSIPFSSNRTSIGVLELGIDA